MSKHHTFVNRHFKHLFVLFTRLGILLLLYLVCRLLFFIFNYSSFSGVGFRVFLGGLRFDAAVIALINLPYAILSLLPFPFRNKSGYQKFLQYWFYLTNIPFLMLNLIDVAYFKFTFKRSTGDLLEFITTGDDTLNLIPTFLLEYWYLVVIFLLVCGTLVLLYRTTLNFKYRKERFWRYFGIHLFLLPIGIALMVILGRGGVQLRPIGLGTAGLYASIQNYPLVLNTPFTFLRTLGKQAIASKDYFRETELENLYPVEKVYNSGEDSLHKPNVVVIILESFSKEYIGAYNDSLPSYTPFLDSLIGQSLHFTNSFANGKKSMEAMPSIFAGIPNLSNQPYITGPFAANKINALPHILNNLGYNTSFYHGGINGTMGFDIFSKVAGFQKYYGKNEYSGPDEDYDGMWGIFDEPYLQYVADEFNAKPEPFMAGVFTLSSHHPFTVPHPYKNQFKGGSEKIMATIQYADMALQRFFAKASRQQWFKNTLFVITADHTSMTEHPYYGSSIGTFAVPIVIYSPSGEITPSESSKTISHIDILPTVLDYIHYDKPFFAMGNSALQSENSGRMVNFLNEIYWYAKDEFLIRWSEERQEGLYNFVKDPLLQHNLAAVDEKMYKLLQNELKAAIQTHNNRMIDNKWNLQEKRK